MCNTTLLRVRSFCTDEYDMVFVSVQWLQAFLIAIDWSFHAPADQINAVDRTVLDGVLRLLLQHLPGDRR